MTMWVWTPFHTGIEWNLVWLVHTTRVSWEASNVSKSAMLSSELRTFLRIRHAFAWSPAPAFRFTNCTSRCLALPRRSCFSSKASSSSSSASPSATAYERAKRKLFEHTKEAQKPQEQMKEKNRRVVLYAAVFAMTFMGLSYAAVPLYKIFCQMTGFGGTTQRADALVAQKLTPREDSQAIRVTFDGGCAATMPWSFRPQQQELLLVPGETALAFYTAKNPTDKAITGVATYNVYPPKAGLYFNKIQCFCFEEQRLRANEEIDMPVLFFIDPEICDDPSMEGVYNITLSYTFWKTDDVNEDDVEDEE